MKKLTSICLMLLLVFTINIQSMQSVEASISQCLAYVSPTTVTPGSTTTFNFQIQNSDAEPIRWFQVSMPLGYFNGIISASTSGWTVSHNEDTAIFENGEIATGQVVNFSVQAQATNQNSPSLRWDVHATDDPSGNGSILCDGDTNVTIQTGAAPNISGIRLSNLKADSVTIQWDTDIPGTSIVRYGTTTELSQTKSSPSLETTHTLRLTGLQPDTAYYYQVASANADGVEGVSEDNTFLTPVSTSTGSDTTTTTPKITTNANAEKEPPGIIVSTKIDKPLRDAPAIKGTASDNVAVARIDYSIDNGLNWAEAQTAQGLGTKKVSFSFTPRLIEDGNYKIIARATDTSGNQAFSPVQLLILDRLPPQVGGSVINIGSQILHASDKQTLDAVVGVEYKFTTSAIGGATEIQIVAAQPNSATEKKFHLLNRTEDTGLWVGILSFDKAGTYELVAESVDGAGNRTSRLLHTVQVTSPMRVTDTNDQPVTGTKATLHSWNDELNRWEIWDGKAYGQQNPQSINENGELGFFIPAGTYYAKISAPGYHTTISDRFTLMSTQALSNQLILNKASQLKLFGKSVTIPSWSTPTFVMQTTTQTSNTSAAPNEVVGKAFPSFNLQTTTGEKLTALNLRGKYTVVSTVASWSPGTAEILPQIEELQKNKDFRFLPLFVQDRQEKVANYLLAGGYEVSALVDPDGQLVDKLAIGEVPAHYIVDRRGVVKRVVTGVLTKDELLKALVGL
jgi:hypothetical protein